MRVVFFGYQTWGYRTLQALIDLGHEIVLAVTHPMSEDAYKAIWAAPVEELAREHGIPAHFTKRVDAETIDLVRSVDPDVIVVNSWYNRMPVELYDLPPYGTLNFHDSLLPKFTGFSPVLWALISGESEFGLTVHRMDSGLDTGDILVQRSLPIGPTDTGTELVLRGMELIPRVLAEALNALESGSAAWRPQNKAERTFCHKRSEQDSALDWAWPHGGSGTVCSCAVRAVSSCVRFLQYGADRGFGGACVRGPLRRHAGASDGPGTGRRCGVRTRRSSRRKPWIGHYTYSAC